MQEFKTIPVTHLYDKSYWVLQKMIILEKSYKYSEICFQALLSFKQINPRKFRFLLLL